MILTSPHAHTARASRKRTYGDPSGRSFSLVCQNQVHVSTPHRENDYHANILLDLIHQSDSSGNQNDRSPNTRSTSSSAAPSAIAELAYKEQDTLHIQGLTSSTSRAPIIHDTTEVLKTSLQLLEMRVGSLERRLPKVERTMTSMNFMISTSYGAPTTSNTFRNISSRPSQSSNGESSSRIQLAANVDAGGILFPGGHSETATSTSSSAEQASNCVAGTGKQPSRVSDGSPTSTLINDLELDGGTLFRPSIGDRLPEYCDTGMVDSVDGWPNEKSRGACQNCSCEEGPCLGEPCTVFSSALEEFLKSGDAIGGTEEQDIVMMDGNANIIPQMWTGDLFGS